MELQTNSARAAMPQRTWLTMTGLRISVSQQYWSAFKFVEPGVAKDQKKSGGLAIGHNSSKRQAVRPVFGRNGLSDHQLCIDDRLTR